MSNETNGIDEMFSLNAAKAGVAIGLLLQQASAFSCEVVVTDHVQHAYHQSSFSSERANDELHEAVSSIKELSRMLKYAYRVLANATDENVDNVLSIIEPEKSRLIEHQLRGLEGAMKSVFKEASADFKEIARDIYIVVADARSAVTNLNSLIKQRSCVPVVFDSSVDMAGLRALAEHGTRVFHSGNFH
ncbi:TPA: hypothetical protein IP609_003553 [Escherichia coli]|nr:hypothetical protein [Escherichia coli]